MNYVPRSPALAVAVLFGLFAMITLMDPAHFQQEPRAAPGASTEGRPGR